MSHKDKPALSYLTHTQEIALILSRFLRDLDSLKLLLKQCVISEIAWNRDFYVHIYRYHTGEPQINRHFLHFDIQHFYPKFLSELNLETRFYESMNIRGKVQILKKLNKDDKTVQMRRKSIYLFQRNRVDESRNYPMENMIHANSAKYLVGVMNYTG